MHGFYTWISAAQFCPTSSPASLCHPSSTISYYKDTFAFCVYGVLDKFEELAELLLDKGRQAICKAFVKATASSLLLEFCFDLGFEIRVI